MVVTNRMFRNFLVQFLKNFMSQKRKKKRSIFAGASKHIQEIRQFNLQLKYGEIKNLLDFKRTNRSCYVLQEFIFIIARDIFRKCVLALFQENNRFSLIRPFYPSSLCLGVSARRSKTLIRYAITTWFLNESRARLAHCQSLKRRRRLSLIDYRLHADEISIIT